MDTYAMTSALRSALRDAIATEYADDVESRHELLQLVQMHYAGDRLSFELADLVRDHDLRHLAAD